MAPRSPFFFRTVFYSLSFFGFDFHLNCYNGIQRTCVYFYIYIWCNALGLYVSNAVSAAAAVVADKEK